MYSTYHFESVDEISNNIIEAIKAAYKGKSVRITVEEENANDYITDSERQLLDARLMEDESTYLSAEESIAQLKAKHGL